MNRSTRNTAAGARPATGVRARVAQNRARTHEARTLVADMYRSVPHLYIAVVALLLAALSVPLAVDTGLNPYIVAGVIVAVITAVHFSIHQTAVAATLLVMALFLPMIPPLAAYMLYFAKTPYVVPMFAYGALFGILVLAVLAACRWGAGRTWVTTVWIVVFMMMVAPFVTMAFPALGLTPAAAGAALAVFLRSRWLRRRVGQWWSKRRTPTTTAAPGDARP